MQRTDNKILFESQERFNKIDELFKKANPVLKKNPNILKQKYKDGTETGDLIYRFTPEYHADRNELFIKATTNKSKESWDSYRN